MGGGALLDIGCYPVTLSRWLFDSEPLEVMALIERDPELRIDGLDSGILRFPSGQASFTCSGQVALDQWMQIYGTKGRLRVDLPFNAPQDRPTHIVFDDGRDLDGGGAERIEIPAVNQYMLQGEQFARAVRGMGAAPVPAEDAVRNMAVIDALFRSADSGRWERPES